MPSPGDNILLSATLLAMYGVAPSSHSCEVEIRDEDGAVVVAKTAMTNVIDTIYTYKWVTAPALPEGSYQAIYYAILDTVAAPPIGEVIYVETVSADVSAIIDKLDQLLAIIFDDKYANYEYDTQGRVSKVTFNYGDDVTPTYTYEMAFTYNSDNSVATYNVVRIIP